MDDTLYQVLVTGQLAGQVSPAQACRAFAHLFCVTEDEAALRFQAAPFVVRGRLSREQAEKYCRVIRRQGIVCEIQPDCVLPTLYPRLPVAGD